LRTEKDDDVALVTRYGEAEPEGFNISNQSTTYPDACGDVPTYQGLLVNFNFKVRQNQSCNE
jgi:hypothetical protein